MVDNNEAPKGYKAVASSMFCEGCAFRYSQTCMEDDNIKCTSFFREDKSDVIFVVTSAPATLLHPMGSMGEAI